MLLTLNSMIYGMHEVPYEYKYFLKLFKHIISQIFILEKVDKGFGLVFKKVVQKTIFEVIFNFNFI